MKTATNVCTERVMVCVIVYVRCVSVCCVCRRHPQPSFQGEGVRLVERSPIEYSSYCPIHSVSVCFPFHSTWQLPFTPDVFHRLYKGQLINNALCTTTYQRT